MTEEEKKRILQCTKGIEGERLLKYTKKLCYLLWGYSRDIGEMTLTHQQIYQLSQVSDEIKIQAYELSK